jgi:SpoVK/Ycf46/Vps4 family AAA+-type ATPase
MLYKRSLFFENYISTIALRAINAPNLQNWHCRNLSFINNGFAEPYRGKSHKCKVDGVGKALASKTLTNTFVLPNKSKQLNKNLIQVLRLLLQNNYYVSSVISKEKDYSSYGMIKAPELQETKLEYIKHKSKAQANFTLGVKVYKHSMSSDTRTLNLPTFNKKSLLQKILFKASLESVFFNKKTSLHLVLEQNEISTTPNSATRNNDAFPALSGPDYNRYIRGGALFSIDNNPSILELGSKSFLNKKTANQKSFVYGPPKAAQYWLLPFLGFYCFLSNSYEQTTLNKTFFDSNLKVTQSKLMEDTHNQLSFKHVSLIGENVNKPSVSGALALNIGSLPRDISQDFLVEPSKHVQNEFLDTKEANSYAELEQLALFYLNKLEFMREAPISAKTKTQAYIYRKETPLSAETSLSMTVKAPPPRAYGTFTLAQEHKPLFSNQDLFINSFYTAVDFYKSYFKTCWYKLHTYNTNPNFEIKNDVWECLLTSKKTANFNTLQLEDSKLSSVSNIGVTPTSKYKFQKTSVDEALALQIKQAYGLRPTHRDSTKTSSCDGPTTNYVTVKGIKGYATKALCNNWIFDKSKKEIALKSRFLETNNKKSIKLALISSSNNNYLITHSAINNTDIIGRTTYIHVKNMYRDFRNEASFKLAQKLSHKSSFKLNKATPKLAKCVAPEIALRVTTPVNDYKKLCLVLDNLIQSYNWNFLGSSKDNLLHIIRYAPRKSILEGQASKSGLALRVHRMLGYYNISNSLTSENKYTSKTAYLEKLKEQNIVFKSKQIVTKDILKKASAAISFNQNRTVQPEAVFNNTNRSIIKRAFNGTLDSTFSLFTCSNMFSSTAELVQNNILLIARSAIKPSWQPKNEVLFKASREAINVNSLNSLQVKGLGDLTSATRNTTSNSPVFPKATFIKLKSPLLTSSNFLNTGKPDKTQPLLTNTFSKVSSENLKQEAGLPNKNLFASHQPMTDFEMWRWRNLNLNLEKDTAYIRISNSSKTRKTDRQQNTYGIKQSFVQTINNSGALIKDVNKHVALEQKKPWDIRQRWLGKPYEKATLVSAVDPLAPTEPQTESSEYKAAPIFRLLQNYVKKISVGVALALESNWSSLQLIFQNTDLTNRASKRSLMAEPLIKGYALNFATRLNTILQNYKPNVDKSSFAPVATQQKSDVVGVGEALAPLDSKRLDMPLKHKNKTVDSFFKKNKFYISDRMPLRNSLGKPIISIVLEHKKFMFSKANITDNLSNRDLFKQQKTYIRYAESKKAIQKKLKAKKQRLENRYQKKRKRFYPRPTWLRLRLGYSFFKTKTKTKHNSFLLKAENNKNSDSRFKMDKWESALNTVNASNITSNLWFSNKNHDRMTTSLLSHSQVSGDLNSVLTTKQKQRIFTNYYAWQLCFSEGKLKQNKVTYGCNFAKKNLLLSLGRSPIKTLLKIKNKNSKSYSSFENKSANSVPQKKDKNSNLIRDFWIWLYNITNKSAEPYNSNLLLNNIIKNLSIPVDLTTHPRNSIWQPKGDANTNYTNTYLGLHQNAVEEALSSVGRASALTEALPWQQVGVNSKIDSKKRASTKELAGDVGFDANVPLQQSESPKTIGPSINIGRSPIDELSELGSKQSLDNTAKSKRSLIPTRIDQSYSDQAIAYNSNTKNLIRIRWALNKTNLWASTNKRLDLWSTQKLRNQSKNNKTKFIEKQLKKQANNFFSSVYLKDFIKNQKIVAKDGLDLDNNSKISATQISFATNFDKAKSVAKSNINQKIHQKEQKLLYLTNIVSEKLGSKLNTKKLNAKRFSLNTIGTQQINSKQPTAALLNKFSKQNPLYNKISLNFVSKPHSEFNFCWYKTGFFNGIGNGYLNPFLASNEMGKIGSIPLPINMYNAYLLTGQNHGATPALRGQNQAQYNDTPIVERDTLFKSKAPPTRSNLVFTNTVTSVSIVALLFHFCALISLISISQIRSFLQFHLILIHKLSNIYLQIIHKNLKITSQLLSALRLTKKDMGLSLHVADPRSGYKAYLTEESNQGFKRTISFGLTRAARYKPIVDNVNISKSLYSANAPQTRYTKKYKTLKIAITSYLAFNGLSTKVGRDGIKQSSLKQKGSNVGLSLNSNVAQARANSKTKKMLNLLIARSAINSLRSASLNTNQNRSIRSLLESFVLQKTLLLEKPEKISLSDHRPLKSNLTGINIGLRPSFAQKNVSEAESKGLGKISKLTIFLLKLFLFNFLNRKTPHQTNKQPTEVQSNLIQKGKTKSAVGGLESFSALENQNLLRKAHLKQSLNLLFLSNQYKLKGFKTQSFNTVKKVTFDTGFKIVDTFESFLRLIYSFFEKPAEFTMDWVAFAFLVEWSSDRIAYTPEKNSKKTWIAFSKIARQNKSFGVWFSLFYGTNLGMFTPHSGVNTAALANPNLIENYGLTLDKQSLATPGVQQSDLISRFSNPMFSFWILTLSQFFYKRILYLNDMFLDLLNRPDTDLLYRQRKGTLFWDIWSDVLIKAADKYNINVPSLSNIKEEQNLLIDRFLTEPKTKVTPRFRAKAYWLSQPTLPIQKKAPKTNRVDNTRSAPLTTVLLQGLNLSVENPSQHTAAFQKNSMRSMQLSYMDYAKRSLASIHILSATRNNKGSLQDGLESASSNNGFLSQADYSSLHGLGYNLTCDANQLRATPNLIAPSNQTKVALGGQEDTDLFSAKDINQFVTYQSKETDLFIDYHPPKAFNHINSIKYYNFAAMPQTIGTLVCQIYSGIFNKQIAKNVLVISHGSGKNLATVGGSTSSGSIVADTALERMQKTLLIQALAGETEMKIITDNASRYAIVNRGFAVGIKLLKDVFEALSLNTPCFFLLEDIHLIGERRPFLISDHGDSFGDDMSKASETAFGAQSNGSSGGAQAVHEKNQVYYQLSRHGITHYKKPFKGDVSLSIPTNHFSFDLFLKTRYSNFSLHRTTTNPLAYTLNYNDTRSANSNQNSESILKSVVQKLTSKRSMSGLSTGQNSTLNDATGGLLASYLQLAVSQNNSSAEQSESSVTPRTRVGKALAKRGAMRSLNKNGLDKRSLAELSSAYISSKGGAAAPPQTGSKPSALTFLKEQKRLKPKQTVKELPWIGLPTEQFALLPRVSYSVRAKVAALADLAFSNMSAKLDMITDLLVIIDSVRGNRGFVVFGTTHLPHILDPALRRPGRFDETISIPTLPNLWNRWEFIKASQPIIAPEILKSYNSIVTYGSLIPSPGASSTSINPLKLTAGPIYNSSTILAYHGTLDYLDFLNLDFIPNNNKNLFSSLVTRFKKNTNAKKNINLEKQSLAQGCIDDQKVIKRLAISYADATFKLDMQKKYSKMSNVAYSQMGKKVITNKYVYNLSNSTPVYNNPKTAESSVALTETVEFLSNQNQYTSLYGSTTMLRNTLLSLISGKLSSSFALKNKPISATRSFLRSGVVGLDIQDTRLESPILQKPFNTFKAFVKQNLCSLYGIDQTWRAVTTLAFSFVQKRYLYHKNLIVPKLLNFTDSSPLEEPPSPPTSNLLIPSKRYENYKKAFKENISFGGAQRKVTNTIQEKIEAHTKQAYIKSIYNTNKTSATRNLAGKSKAPLYGLSNNINSLAVLKLVQQTNVGNLGVSQHPLTQTSSVNWYYQQKILQRHRNYLKNQWWNGQLTEHSAETLFLSDIDWRYTFIENLNSQKFLKTKVQFFETLKQQNKIGGSGFTEPRTPLLQKEQLEKSQSSVYGNNTTQDIVIDFPDADQHYNPKHRRWLITAGYWGSWFSFDKNLQTEIFEHLIFESFVKSYNILNKNRELLDYSASKFIKKGLIKELHIHNNILSF